MPPDLVARILASYPVLHQALRQRELAAPGGGVVSGHQATVLAQLAGPEPITLTRLAATMGVALPTMSLLVDRLVRAGLVRRDRDPVDRRRVALRLSDAGARVLRRRSLLDPERVRALVESLSPGERASVDGLVTLAAAARRLAEAPTSRGDS